MKQLLKETLSIAAALFGLFAGMFILLLGCMVVFVLSEPSPLDHIGDGYCVADCAVYGFQDGTTYREYRYTQASFDNNSFFQPVTKDDMAKIRAYVEQYEGLIRCEPDCASQEAQELYQSYRYDIASLSESDYFYLDTTGSDYPFEEYELYMFDTEGMTLYLLKSNM